MPGGMLPSCFVQDTREARDGLHIFSYCRMVVWHGLGDGVLILARPQTGGGRKGPCLSVVSL